MLFSLKGHNSICNWRLKVAIGILFASLLCCFLLISCGPRDRKRPIGFMRLGNVLDLRNPDIVLKDKNLLLRHDQRGFYAMSLKCTYDSTTLIEIENEDSGRIFLSKSSGSIYNEDGDILRGPSQTPLPYYRLKYERDPDGSEYIVAIIGLEVPSNWRLPLEKSFAIFGKEQSIK